MDEISTLGPTSVAEWDGSGVRAWTLDTADHGVAVATASELGGGDAGMNASIVLRVLSGESGARRDIVEVNAAAAIWIGGHAENFGEGLEMARVAIDTGAASAALDALVTSTAAEAGP